MCLALITATVLPVSGMLLKHSAHSQIKFFYITVNRLMNTSSAVFNDHWFESHQPDFQRALKVIRSFFKTVIFSSYVHHHRHHVQARRVKGNFHSHFQMFRHLVFATRTVIGI